MLQRVRENVGSPRSKARRTSGSRASERDPCALSLVRIAERSDRGLRVSTDALARMRWPAGWTSMASDMVPVMLVDDDGRFRRLARRALTANGLEVVAEAADGHAALVADQSLLPMWCSSTSGSLTSMGSKCHGDYVTVAAIRPSSSFRVATRSTAAGSRAASQPAS